MQNRRLPMEGHFSLTEIATIVLQSHWVSHVWSYLPWCEVYFYQDGRWQILSMLRKGKEILPTRKIKKE